MKIFAVGDVHISTYSSVLRSRGDVFSTRLEHLIKSLNWVEITSKEYGCDLVVYLGDFFDRQDVNAEEMTAISTVEWNTIPHVFLCGNHEIGLNDNTFNSCSLFSIRGFNVISTPTTIGDFVFIPYQLSHPKFNEVVSGKPKIVFSHNDISGIFFSDGTSISDVGFDKSDIQKGCGLYVNGHLHNNFIDGNILNVGNLCGQNFSEDGFNHTHGAVIIDSDTLQYMRVENPYALYFYKLDLTNASNDTISKLLSECIINPVIAVKMYSEQEKLVEKELEKAKPLAVKKTFVSELNKSDKKDIEVSITINHIDKLKEFICGLYSDDIIRQELGEIIREH